MGEIGDVRQRRDGEVGEVVEEEGWGGKGGGMGEVREEGLGR